MAMKFFAFVLWTLVYCFLSWMQNAKFISFELIKYCIVLNWKNSHRHIFKKQRILGTKNWFIQWSNSLAVICEHYKFVYSLGTNRLLMKLTIIETDYWWNWLLSKQTIDETDYYRNRLLMKLTIIETDYWWNRLLLK